MQLRRTRLRGTADCPLRRELRPADGCDFCTLAGKNRRDRDALVHSAGASCRMSRSARHVMRSSRAWLRSVLPRQLPRLVTLIQWCSVERTGHPEQTPPGLVCGQCTIMRTDAIVAFLVSCQSFRLLRSSASSRACFLRTSAAATEVRTRPRLPGLPGYPAVYSWRKLGGEMPGGEMECSVPPAYGCCACLMRNGRLPYPGGHTASTPTRCESGNSSCHVLQPLERTLT